MEITGKIIAALEPRGGVSQRTGNAWKMQDFVIETVEQYPKRCVFNIFGEDNLNRFAIQVGQMYTVSFDINAREYNGRWYNDVRAWNVVLANTEAQAPIPSDMPPFAEPAPMASAAPAAPTTSAAPAASTDPFAAGEAKDDLPF